MSSLFRAFAFNFMWMCARMVSLLRHFIMKKAFNFSFSELSWNLWCIASIVGIWPRFIEPRLIATTKLKVPIANLSQELNGLKILQLSDLHLGAYMSDAFIDKLISKIQSLSPDIIVFTGDFICYSNLHDADRLKKVLCSLQAPLGCYAVLGNHDYRDYVSINSEGYYDVINCTESTLKKGWKRLFSSINLLGESTEKALAVQLNTPLVDLLKKTPFKLLNNENSLIPIGNSYLNICGLGEHMLGQCRPELAFKQYHPQYPGIILTHNPDSIPSLQNYPGDIILCGHTHGGQINLPGLCKKFMLLENMKFKRGLHSFFDKKVYINRGIGSVMKFRWFAMPEILLLNLCQK